MSYWLDIYLVVTALFAASGILAGCITALAAPEELEPKYVFLAAGAIPVWPLGLLVIAGFVLFGLQRLARIMARGAVTTWGEARGRISDQWLLLQLRRSERRGVRAHKNDFPTARVHKP